MRYSYYYEKSFVIESGGPHIMLKKQRLVTHVWKDTRNDKVQVVRRGDDPLTVLRKEGSITSAGKDIINFGVGILTSEEPYTYLMSSFNLLSSLLFLPLFPLIHPRRRKQLSVPPNLGLFLFPHSFVLPLSSFPLI